MLVKIKKNEVKIKFEENILIKEFKGAAIQKVLEREYQDASRDLDWQYIYPFRKPTINPRSGKLKQHYRHESFLQKAVKNAIKKS